MASAIDALRRRAEEIRQAQGSTTSAPTATTNTVTTESPTMQALRRRAAEQRSPGYVMSEQPQSTSFAQRLADYETEKQREAVSWLENERRAQSVEEELYKVNQQIADLSKSGTSDATRLKGLLDARDRLTASRDVYNAYTAQKNGTASTQPSTAAQPATPTNSEYNRSRTSVERSSAMDSAFGQIRANVQQEQQQEEQRRAEAEAALRQARTIVGMGKTSQQLMEERAQLAQRLANVSRNQPERGYQAETEFLRSQVAALDAQIESVWDAEQLVKSYEQSDAGLAEKVSEYEQRMANDADFIKYAAAGMSMANPTFEEAQGGIGFGEHRIGAKEVANPVLFTFANADKFSSMDSDSGGYIGGDYRYLNMTADEVLTYSALLAKEGADSANGYLAALMPALNQRAGQQTSQAILNADNPLARTAAIGLHGISAGLDQFASGTRQYFTDERIPTSPTQYASADIADSLSGGGKVLYDLITTTANMAPSMLLSTITAGLGASAGVAGAIGNAALGASIAGNAYNQALAEGRPEAEARAYSTLVGASEGLTQHLLGGISKLGGKVSGHVLAKKIATLDSVFKQSAAKLVVSMASEGFEESLQTYLEPLFASLIFDEKYDAPEFGEVAYSFMLGALSAGVLEGGDVITAQRSQDRERGREIILDGGADALIAAGMGADASGAARRLAAKLNTLKSKGKKKITATQLGRLARLAADEAGRAEKTAQATASIPASAPNIRPTYNSATGHVTTLETQQSAEAAVSDEGYLSALVGMLERGEITDDEYNELWNLHHASSGSSRTERNGAPGVAPRFDPKTGGFFLPTAKEQMDAVLNRGGGYLPNAYDAGTSQQLRDALDTLGRMFGKVYTFTDSITNAAGQTSNGVYSTQSGIIAVSRDAAQSVPWIIGHETGHVLADMDRKAWTDFQKYAVSIDPAAKKAKLDRGMSEAVASEEVAADLLGQMLTDERTLVRFTNELQRSVERGQVKPNLIERIAAAIRRFVAKLRRSSFAFRGAANLQSVGISVKQAEAAVTRLETLARSVATSFAPSTVGGSVVSLGGTYRATGINTAGQSGQGRAILGANNSTAGTPNAVPAAEPSSDLTPDELAALAAYKSSESYKINAKLREAPHTLTEQDREFIRALDSAIEKLPTYRGRVYRRIPLDTFGNAVDSAVDVERWLSEGIYSTPGYTSASSAPDGYPVDGKYVLLIIESESGKDMEGHGNNMEREVIYPRGFEFSVSYRFEHTTDGAQVLHLEENGNGTRQVGGVGGVRVHSGIRPDDRSADKSLSALPTLQGVGGAASSGVEGSSVDTVANGVHDAAARAGEHLPSAPQNGRGAARSEAAGVQQLRAGGNGDGMETAAPGAVYAQGAPGGRDGAAVLGMQELQSQGYVGADAGTSDAEAVSLHMGMRGVPGRDTGVSDAGRGTDRGVEGLQGLRAEGAVGGVGFDDDLPDEVLLASDDYIDELEYRLRSGELTAEEYDELFRAYLEQNPEERQWHEFGDYGAKFSLIEDEAAGVVREAERDVDATIFEYGGRLLNTTYQEELMRLPDRLRKRVFGHNWMAAHTFGRRIGIPETAIDGILKRPVEELSAHYMAVGSIREQASDSLFETVFERSSRIIGVKLSLDKPAAKAEWDDMVGKLSHELMLEKRYEEYRRTAETSKQAEREKRDAMTPKTPEEALKLGEEVADLRRKKELAEHRARLIEDDRALLSRLMRGEMELTSLELQGSVNRANIVKVYEAWKAWDSKNKALERYRRGILDGLRADIREHLKGIAVYKDKKAGILYSTETMARNILDIIPEEYAADREYLTQMLVTNVQKSNAEKVHLKDEYRGKIRDLNLSREVKDGNAVSESAAVQMLGEARDSIRILERSRGRMRYHEGRTLEEWTAVVDELKANNPSMDWDKVDRAIEVFREVYDELIAKMNRVLVENGYPPVPYRSGYFPHFNDPDKGDSIIAQIGKAVGIVTEVTVLPTDINGLTHMFKPGKPWFSHAQERRGFETAYDAVLGFDRYIEGVADVICHTTNIRRARALAQEIRYLSSAEGVQKLEDAVLADESLSDEIREARIAQIHEGSAYRLSNFVVYLDEWTNLLANKKSSGDREFEKEFSRKAYNVVNGIFNRFGSSVIGFNLSSAASNLVTLPTAWADIPAKYLAGAARDAFKNVKMTDSFSYGSAFLSNRKGSDPLIKRGLQNMSSKAVVAGAQKAGQYLTDASGIFMNFTDSFTAELVVRARYAQNLDRGMSEAAAMDEADSFAASLFAERAKGAMPTIFEQRNPETRAFTQFQLEVNNYFRFAFKDLPRLAREQLSSAIGWKLLRLAIGAWLFNDFFEKLFGRDVAPDVIGTVGETVGDFTGYELQNAFDWGWEILTKLDINPIERVEALDASDAVINLASNVVSEVPFIGGVLGDGGRVPISSIFPDGKGLVKMIFSGLGGDESSESNGWSAARKRAEAKDLLISTAALLVPGGNAFKKAAQGVSAAVQRGSYYVDTDGNKLLQYPIHRDNIWEDVGAFFKGVIAGKTSHGTAQKWIDEGFNGYTARQTTAYVAMLAAGVDGKKTIALLEQLEDIDNDKTLEGDDAKSAARRQAIRAANLPGEARFAAYYSTLASNYKDYALMPELVRMGEDPGEIVDFFMDYSDLGKQGTDDVEATYLQRNRLLEANISGEALTYIYYEKILTSQSEEERALMDDLELAGANMGKVTRALIGIANGSDGIEQRTAILNSGLSDQIKGTLYVEKLYGTDDEAKAQEKVDAFREAGLTVDDLLIVHNKNAELERVEDMRASEQLDEFKKWLRTQGYTRAQQKVILEHYGFYSHIKAE